MKIEKQRFKTAVATHLLLKKEDKVLLLLRQNTDYADGFYSVVAGHIDGDEDIITATIREAKEEADIVLNPKKLEFGCVLHRKTSNKEIIDFFFIANKWPETLKNAEPEKCKELKFFSVNELPGNIIPYVAHGIDCSIRGLKQSIFGW